MARLATEAIIGTSADIFTAEGHAFDDEYLSADDVIALRHATLAAIVADIG